MDCVKVYTDNHMVYFNIEDNTMLVYKGIHTFKVKSFKHYREVTNDVIKKLLIKEHNDLMNSIIEKDRGFNVTQFIRNAIIKCE